MTEAKFRKKLVWRVWIALALVAIGIVLTVLTMIRQGGIMPADSFMNELSHAGAFGAGYGYGISLGITFSGMATFIKTVVLLKNQDKFKKVYVLETDERNVEIIRKAMSLSWFSTIYIVLIATFFVPKEIIIILLGVLLIMVAIYAISYYILQKIS